MILYFKTLSYVAKLIFQSFIYLALRKATYYLTVFSLHGLRKALVAQNSATLV